MSREFARAFYSSEAWNKCREGYKHFRGGLCERCLKKGLYRPAVIVHHKVYIAPENINNPEVTLNWANLEAVCRECHEDEHRGGRNRRYKVNEDGTVEIL